MCDMVNTARKTIRDPVEFCVKPFYPLNELRAGLDHHQRLFPVSSCRMYGLSQPIVFYTHKQLIPPKIYLQRRYFDDDSRTEKKQENLQAEKNMLIEEYNKRNIVDPSSFEHAHAQNEDIRTVRLQKSDQYGIFHMIENHQTSIIRVVKMEDVCEIKTRLQSKPFCWAKVIYNPEFSKYEFKSFS